MISLVKKPKTLLFLIAGLMAMALLCPYPAYPEIIQGPGGTSAWNSFPGDFHLTPAFPDTCSRYDTFVFKPDTGNFEILKITGEFPYARYFSFNLYDFFEATDFAALADYEIIPDAGSDNPYEVQGDRFTTSRSYTLWLVKAGVAVPEGARNVMVIPPDIRRVSLFTRVYRPDLGYDSLGGVSLPTIEALTQDLESATAPEFGMDLEALLSKIPMFLFNSDLIATYDIASQLYGNEVVFHRITDAGLFPNAHNEYIIANLPEDYFDKVAVITLTPPTFEDTYDGGGFQGGKDVRYWSFCIGGLGLTRTPDCLYDDEVVKNQDGTITICIAPLFMKDWVEAAGFNYLRWGLVYKPIVLHRHMLADPNFSGSISQVPAIGRPPAEEDQTLEYYDATAARNYMGAYSPEGEIFTLLEFLLWLWTP